jgi:hypothetical protein
MRLRLPKTADENFAGSGIRVQELRENPRD